MLVIFDCDGVLIDSEIIACRTSAEYANNIGHNITTLEVAQRFAGKPSRVLWETICLEAGVEFEEKTFRELMDYTYEIFETELETTKGIKEVLGRLDNDFCVASTTRLENLRHNLTNVGLIDYFGQNVFSASQVERPKPAPDVFLFAAKNMGYDPKDCIVIEDSIPGVQAAKAANMRVFGYLGGSHITEGHGQNLINNGASACFSDMKQFFDFMEMQKVKIKTKS